MFSDTVRNCIRLASFFFSFHYSLQQQWESKQTDAWHSDQFPAETKFWNEPGKTINRHWFTLKHQYVWLETQEHIWKTFFLTFLGFSMFCTFLYIWERGEKRDWISMLANTKKVHVVLLMMLNIIYWHSVCYITHFISNTEIWNPLLALSGSWF